ncbi:carboxypeptidase-like regulatory domain-containing protein [Salinibacterium sp. ZJ454]|uniref:carboxypeptidase-like regulatory domain-containing protein n=1 Tax=Salinibacterium sp. ZJ454 TaxID=2708339 RepID=UPI00141DFB0B|nr:carboxypeptidase-like regulatory domain-containing protein [Salinibacterium sp. ZJ454]
MKLFARSIATVSAGLVALTFLSACAQSSSSEVDGVVVDAAGSPLSRCAIEVVVVDAPPYPEISQVTGEDGEFSWTLPDGLYDIVAHCGGEPGRERVQVPSESELRITVQQ